MLTVTKDMIFSNLNEFLMSLTDATYQPMGLTILYVPREGMLFNENKELNINLIDVDKINIKNGLIERLERVARYWIKQIRGVLKEINILARATCLTIIEIIEFWQQKCLLKLFLYVN